MLEGGATSAACHGEHAVFLSSAGPNRRALRAGDAGTSIEPDAQLPDIERGCAR